LTHLHITIFKANFFLQSSENFVETGGSFVIFSAPVRFCIATRGQEAIRTGASNAANLVRAAEEVSITFNELKPSGENLSEENYSCGIADRMFR
jgi:hypothetical protein